MDVGDKVTINEPVFHKWWVKLWFFITFRKLERKITHEYIIKSVDSSTCITISSFYPDLVKNIEVTKPKQPNFSRFQNDFKRRGRK